jgi:hypothetical protein
MGAAWTRWVWSAFLSIAALHGMAAESDADDVRARRPARGSRPQAGKGSRDEISQGTRSHGAAPRRPRSLFRDSGEAWVVGVVLVPLGPAGPFRFPEP